MNKNHVITKIATRKNLLAAFLSLLLGIQTVDAAVRFVMPEGKGLENGSSWANASGDLQAMINTSSPGDEIWVSKGSYYPTHSAVGWTEAAPTGVNSNPADQNNAFVLKSGVKIYGGFSGSETLLSQRNWMTNNTYLSGDLGKNDRTASPSYEADACENAYHVVITVNNTAETMLDGFTVCGGNSYSSQCTVPSFNISVNGRNISSHNGGGIYAVNSAIRLGNLEIRRNAAPYAGAGLYCYQSSDLRGYNLYFQKNFGSYGGAICTDACSPKFKNMILSENESSWGAGVFNTGQLTSENGEAVWINSYPTFINTLIHSNLGAPKINELNGEHYGYGAGIFNRASSPELINCTVVGNHGGLHAGMYSCFNSYPKVNNSIFWNNKASDWDIYTNVRIANVYDDSYCSTTYRNSLLQGTDLSGNSQDGLNAAIQGFDPMFISPPGYNWYDAGGIGSFTLKEGSPCIDKGSNSLYNAACSGEFQEWDDTYTVTPPPYGTGDGFFLGTGYPRDDFSGRKTPRFVGERIDIGIFEWRNINSDLEPEPECNGGTIRYVTQTGNGSKDGSSWNNASDDIQAMINISEVCDEVWVAQGIYLPSHSANGWTDSTPTGVNVNPKDQNNAFVMKNGVKVYGGFTGNETSLGQRSWIKNQTILSGDFNNDDAGSDSKNGSHAENAHHVVIAANVKAGTELNGFFIRGGGHFTDYTELGQDTRTAIVNNEVVSVRNGGGIHIVKSAIFLQNLDIQANGGNNGGGIYCGDSFGARANNLNIRGNSATSGGGINATRSDIRFKNLMVTENNALYGGGITNEGGQCKPEYVNLQLWNNQADFYGGFGAGMHNNTSSPVITNATIVYNYGGQHAGMINSVSAYPVVNNSIIYDNSALSAPSWYGYIDNVGTWSGSVTYNHSLLQFTDLSSSGGLNASVQGFSPRFIPNTLSPDAGSPCIDAGSNALYEATCGSDFIGWENEYTFTMDESNPEKGVIRLSGERIDIGAYERIIVVPPPTCEGPHIIRYVTPGGRGVKDGSSWNNASNDIQAMINISDRCDEVWVAKGTYLPTHSASGWTEDTPTGVNTNPKDQNNAFVLKNQVKVYGGFAGNETDPSQRDWIENLTILSGDFNGDDVVDDPAHESASENAFHIVISADNTKETVLDGFSIRRGNYYGSNPDLSIMVNDIKISSNNGGGIYAVNSAVLLKNLEIRKNGGPNVGAGIYCSKSSDLRGENLFIYKNYASQGGGIFTGNCSPIFKNIVIANNQAGIGAGISNSGGLRYESGNWYSDISSPHYINALIHTNIGSPSNGYGAGMQNERSSPILTNVTIAGNYGGIAAAGIYNYYNCFPVINNSIIWNNVGTGYVIKNVQNDNDCYMTYNHSLLQNTDLSATGGLNATAQGFDPKFISAPSNILLGSIGSFTLQSGSPCIGAGDPNLYMNALGNEFQGWENEFALTPPPYSAWKATFDETFFGAWYPTDQYSGIKGSRTHGNLIEIGAFGVPDNTFGLLAAPANSTETTGIGSATGTNTEKLSVYPNPAVSGSAVQISLPFISSGTEQGGSVEIYNITGQFVKRISVPSDSQTFDATIQLPAGYYILKWKNHEVKLPVR